MTFEYIVFEEAWHVPLQWEMLEYASLILRCLQERCSYRPTKLFTSRHYWPTLSQSPSTATTGGGLARSGMVVMVEMPDRGSSSGIVPMALVLFFFSWLECFRVYAV